MVSPDAGRRWGYLIWAYSAAYILLGSLLFSNFYPFTWEAPRIDFFIIQAELSHCWSGSHHVSQSSLIICSASTWDQPQNFRLVIIEVSLPLSLELAFCWLGVGTSGFETQKRGDLGGLRKGGRRAEGQWHTWRHHHGRTVFTHHLLRDKP